MFYQDFRGDGRTGPVDELAATPNEFLGAGQRQAFELNPAMQAHRLGELNSLAPREQFTDEMGMTHETPGLAPEDPRASRLTLEEANEAGKTDGLRFSEPPTRAQFEYLRELKQKENQRADILSKSPGLGTSALGFVGEFAASAIDPINIASAFVPIVGPARTAALTARLGVGKARLAKGAIEGTVGTAMVEPLIYGQAQALQQNFTMADAFMDVVFGGVLGAGLHWGGGWAGDKYKAYRKAHEVAEAKVEVDAKIDAYNAWRWANGIDEAPDMRTMKAPPGETPHIIESMKPEERAKTLEAAVKAVENDKFPRMDELLKTSPAARAIALPADPKRPATLRLGGGFRASDFRPDSPADDIMSQHLYSTVHGASPADPVRSGLMVFQQAQKSSKAMKDWSYAPMSQEDFNAKAPRDLMEFPEQQVVVDPERKAIITSPDATLGAIHHEIQRALDMAQGYRGEMAGGYRYHRGDQEGPLAHRRVLDALAQGDPSRAPQASARPEQAVDLFSKSEPIVKPDEAASQAIWERVQDGKDKDLDTLIAEEELEVLEDTARHLQNSARATGIFEKVIPIEEREVLDVMAVSAPAEALKNKLETAVQESVDQDYSDAAVLNQVRALFDADPELLRKWLNEEITDDQFDELAARPLPAKTEDQIELDEPTGEKVVTDEDELINDMAAQVEAMLKGMEPQDATDIEAKVVAREQQLLSGNRQVKDLFRSEELEEFDAANSERAQRQGQGADEAGGGAAAGQQPAGTPLEDGLFATRTGGDGPPDGGASAVVNAERSAPGGERSPVETAQSIGWGAVPKRVITPDGTVEVGVEPVIVELSSLREASGKFQPRDRTRKESDANIMARASNLDPEQLMPTRVSDSGPPIVTPDGGMVISGNGRFKTLGVVYRYGDTMAAQALRYRERLGPAADGFKQPILVMRITDAMTDDELVRFADKSNRGRIEQMSATEKAQRDVQAAGMDLMQLYQGGDFESRNNKQFLSAFMRRVVTSQELGEVSKNGRLTKGGYDRLNAAVLAAAYDDTGVLSLMLESADDNIRSITSAYRDVAPQFMKLRAEIAAGVVKQDMDLTPYMMQAARIISEQRDKGVKISTFLSQQDAFDPLDPVLEGLIRGYYNADLTRALSSLRITEFLDAFVQEARLHQEGGFIPDDTTLTQVVDVAERRKQGLPPDEQDPTGLLGPAPEPRQSAPEVRREAPEPAPAEPRQEAAGGEPAATTPAQNSRADKLTELKDKPDDFAAYLKSLETLKRDKLIEIAEAYFGKELPAKDRRSKQTVLDVIKRGEVSDTGRVSKKADIAANLSVPLNSLAGLSVMQLRKVAKDSGVTLGAKITKKDDIIALMHTIFNADGTRKIGEAADVAPTPAQVVAPAPQVTQQDLLSQAAWSGSRERLEHFVSLTDEKLHLIRDPAEKEIIREATFAVEDAVAALDRKRFDVATQKVAEAVEFAGKLNSRASELWAQELRQVVRDRGIVAEKQGEVDAKPASPTPTPSSGAAADLPLAKFYDYLEGPNVVKSSRWMAKQLGTSVEVALKLLDHGVDHGWLKLKDDGTYIRLPKKDRPVRPGDFAIADEVNLKDAALTNGAEQITPAKAAERVEASRNGPWLSAFISTEGEIVDISKLGINPHEAMNAIANISENGGFSFRAYAGNNGNSFGGSGPHFTRQSFSAIKQILAKIKSPRDAALYRRDHRGVRVVLVDEGAAGQLRSMGYKPLPDTVGETGAQQGDLAKGDWAVGWDQPLDIDLPKTAAEWIGHVENMAVLRLAAQEDVSPLTVLNAYGFTNRSDYVRVAQSKAGFEVPSAYANAVMERELQAQLIGAKVLREATRILPEAIRVSVNQDLSEFGPRVGGVSHKDFIKIAKTWDEGKAINFIHHETVHSLRRMRMFTAYEWKLVEREALGNESWLPSGRREVYVRRYTEEIARRGLDDIGEAEINARLLEEAFAWGYGNWAQSRKAPETMTERLWDRIRTFFDRLFFNAKKFFRAATAEDVMKAIYRGDIGQRWSEWNGGRVDDNARNSLRTFALADSVDDMNGRMKELAFDDSEKRGNLAVRSIEALMPCVAYHL